MTLSLNKNWIIMSYELTGKLLIKFDRNEIYILLFHHFSTSKDYLNEILSFIWYKIIWNEIVCHLTNEYY